ncbi:MAG: tRNA uridine-5-carboxymethylaminomethyl(34) synthesis GTPase MnmE [Simkaniaceae bacterium]|nr:tRNA uridine-5-carboxymethylaminomethyl(34) synthesis GTPase MnmE [Simkaniaceae bacterium]
MEFTHRSYEKGQTIAAIATPPGDGGVAIIRISGPKAIEIGERIFSGPVKKYLTHTVHFGKIYDRQKNVVDEGLLLVMKAPKSYTGEDIIELHCHGGSLVTRKVLEETLHAGARAALPGEFTFQAFINGKIDLTQAEAVQALISSKSDLALKSAEKQLQGSLYANITNYQKNLTEITAIIEAWVDYPEEGLEFASQDELLLQLKKIISEMLQLANTFNDGKTLFAGLTLCLLGAPNVGKSSLMNALSRKNRAIVTNIPGTTRDILEEEISFCGMHFKLLDTAGIRNSPELIEKEGIARAKKAAMEADLVLFIGDIQKGLSLDEQALYKTLPKEKTLLVWNKQDLTHEKPKENGVLLSAKNEQGIDNLKNAISQIIWKSGPPSKEEVWITNERHHQALSSAITFLELAHKGLEENVSPEFLTLDMKSALKELGTIIGTNVTEDVLSAIFSKFCVGK